uniref:DOMON domain-containing protein n=1 Tax=Anopheles farauti TaxID=69004 RepID=A0A182Q0T9_9DIPT
MARCIASAREDGYRSPLTNYNRPFRLNAVALAVVVVVGLLQPAAHYSAALTVKTPKIEPVHHRWSRSEAMDSNGLYTLDWHIDQKDIVFTATANTRGFMGLGFSHRSEHMAGSDLVLVWVDDRTGKPNVLESISSHACSTSPCRDSGSGAATELKWNRRDRIESKHAGVTRLKGPVLRSMRAWQLQNGPINARKPKPNSVHKTHHVTGGREGCRKAENLTRLTLLYGSWSEFSGPACSQGRVRG